MVTNAFKTLLSIMFFKFIYFERDTETASGGEGERGSQAGSTLSTQNLTQGLNLKRCNHDLSQNQKSDA